MPANFSPAGYLKGLGWTGEGTGLTSAPHARARPVTVAHKKTLAGVGKDRDTAFPWWESVFSTVATKVGTEKNDLHRTKTGIISNKPPPPKADTYVPLFPSTSASTSTSASASPAPAASFEGTATFADPYASRSALNLEALAQAKIEQARRQLYSSFIRGKAIAQTGTGAESSASTSRATSPVPRKGKRKAGQYAADYESEEEDEETKAESKRRRKEQKAMRKELRAKRRVARAAKRAEKGGEDSSAVPTPVDSSDSEEAVLVEKPEEVEVKLSKEERRAAKKAKKSAQPSADDVELVDSPAKDKEDRAARKAAKAAEKARKEKKKKVKVDRDFKSPEEALAEDEEAYAAARKVAKEAKKAEKRLKQAVEHSLDS